MYNRLVIYIDIVQGKEAVTVLILTAIVTTVLLLILLLLQVLCNFNGAGVVGLCHPAVLLQCGQ